MRQDLVDEDGVRDLRSVKQVHFEQTSLQVRLLGLVILERLQEEGRRGLDHVLRHEDVDDPLHVNEGAGLVLDQLRRKLGALLGVDAHDVLQETDVVGSVAGLLRVQHDLLRLAGLSEASDDLVRDIGAEVDGEREGHVERTNNIAELLAASQLVLLQPLLEQLLATLLQNRARKLQRFELVELALLKQDAEVLQDGGQPAGR